MNNGQWETSGGLEDLALLSVVFAEAAKKYRKPHYLHALKKLHQLAQQKNYNRDLEIFSDHNLNPEDDLEFHLEMNAWLALSFIENPRATDQDETNHPGYDPLFFSYRCSTGGPPLGQQRLVFLRPIRCLPDCLSKVEKALKSFGIS